MSHFRKALMASAITATLIPATASGAGFGLIQHSAKTGGTAYAGTAVTSSDPATVFFNPAGMTRNEGSAVAGVLSYVQPEFEFEGGRDDTGDGDFEETGTGKTDESGTPA